MDIVENIYRYNETRRLNKTNRRERGALSLTESIRRVNLSGKIAIIAEYKRRSPSGFIMAGNYSVLGYLGGIKNERIAGYSVLTEEKYFSGSFDDVWIAHQLNMPILAKDFISNELMIDAAYCAGSDCILLISDFLSREKLIALSDYARSKGLDVLVEFHSPGEIPKVLSVKGAIIGYNRRNLRTMGMEPEESEILPKLSASNSLLVLESGLDSKNLKSIDLKRFNALLIGTSMLNGEHVGEVLDGMGI
ncbi:MAG: indole-3-glycerol-phosphate synthase [Candidatus Thermoplasmatota archaeon]|nr:indole-3-glycerol-phosphate synthase [Candidatus Thermoplasmatota archaeon]